MNEPEYKCPNCGTKDIAFFRIDWKREKIIFLCNCCGEIFEIEEKEIDYPPKWVAMLKTKYPPPKKENIGKGIFP